MVLADEEPLSLGGSSSAAPSQTASSKAPRPPLLARPVGYTLLWVDEQRVRAGDLNYLSLWRPMAPAGCVALGCMAGTGSLQPPTVIIRWVCGGLCVVVCAISCRLKAKVWQNGHGFYFDDVV